MYDVTVPRQVGLNTSVPALAVLVRVGRAAVSVTVNQQACTGSHRLLWSGLIRLVPSVIINPPENLLYLYSGRNVNSYMIRNTYVLIIQNYNKQLKI